MLERSKLHTMVRECVGIYGSAPTCHLSALARLQDYTPDQLTHAVQVERSLVRARLMRRSVYTLGHDLFPIAAAATRREVLRTFQAPSRKLGVSYEQMSRKVEQCLSERPLSASEIRARVDPDRALGSRFSILIGRMACECRIVRAGRTGSWRSDRLTYALWSDWIPDVNPEAFPEEEAKRLLAEAYVAAYGPVELEDLAWWAGWSKKDARAAAQGLDLGAEGTEIGKLSGVRLLPVWDVLMVAYRNRDRLFSSELAPFLYDRFGNATSVVLDAGRVVGVWDLGRSDDPLCVKVAPLGRSWPARRWRAVAEEVQRLGQMLGSAKVSVQRRQAPVNLLEAPRNRFLSPLGD